MSNDLIPQIIIDIFANIAANIITSIALAGIAVYLVRRRSKASFESFFGLTQRRKVVVYLSNLWDPHLTTADKPWGSIVAGQEFQASQTMARLFGVSPFSLPELFRDFVDAFFIGRRVELELKVSPMDSEFDSNNNLIVVGSSTKNIVRRIYAKRNAIHVIIDGEPVDVTESEIDIHKNTLTEQFRVVSGKRAGDTPYRHGSYELAIVEKVREQNRVVFFCLGVSGYGSRAAVEYLAHNWKNCGEKTETAVLLDAFGSSKETSVVHRPIGNQLLGKMFINTNSKTIMNQKSCRVTDFEFIGNYFIRVRFDDGAAQVINFEPVLYGEMWGPLRDLKFFDQVSIDPIAHTLTWPNGADFDPETLRHWDEYKDELAERAKSWEKIFA